METWIQQAPHRLDLVRGGKVLRPTDLKRHCIDIYSYISIYLIRRLLAYQIINLSPEQRRNGFLSLKGNALKIKN